MKNCFKCNTLKELSEFYRHPQMLDGHVNKCKECNKSDVRANRAGKIDYYRNYDHGRNMRPDRVKARREYIVTDAGKAATKRSRTAYRKRFPNAYRAKLKFGNALRDKKIHRQYSCSKCSSDIRIEGHHDDYSKPLDVRWLCMICHRAWHKTNTPLNRK